MKKRGPISVTTVYLQPHNILEKILIMQSEFLKNVLVEAEKEPNLQLSPYQELSRYFAASISHYQLSCILLVKDHEFPDQISDSTDLLKPTDTLRSIVALIRPIYEAVSIMRFIEKFSLKLCPDQNEERDKLKNEIAQRLYNLSLYSGVFHMNWQNNFDLPVRKRYENKESHKEGFERIDTQMSKFRGELDKLTKGDYKKYKLSNNLPKDCWEVLKQFFKECEESYSFSREDIFKIAWIEKQIDKDIFDGLMENMKNDVIGNPWKGDPDEYEKSIQPRIALAFLTYRFASQAAHFDSNFIFQNVHCKAMNYANLWSLICLTLPYLNNQLIEILCEVFKIDKNMISPNYAYDELSRELEVWEEKIKVLIFKKI